jgi:phosphatidylserine decarboxylase
MVKDFFRTLTQIFAGTGNMVSEGKPLVTTGLVIAVLGLAFSFMTSKGWPVFIISMGLLFSGFCVFFFRDPQRNVTFEKDEIVCPADGKVMSIVEDKEKNQTVIRIFLSIFNVHIQRSTMDGKIGEIKYTKGKFAFANADEAVDNERNFISISDGKKYAHVEQITGAIARRIKCRVKTGDSVKAGQKIGLIYFGSQVAVYLPSSARIIVKPGQSVQGGIAVLGLWSGKND